MEYTIVLLAAGLSTRYGRLKQLEPVGPGGEALLDYAVFDAHRAGFDRVVLIIREELERSFRDHISGRWPEGMEVLFHHQRLEDLPTNGIRGEEAIRLFTARRKPWGTAHALWSARELLGDAFAVLNADDLYGPSGFSRAAALLEHGLFNDPGAAVECGLVAYRLGDTLSPHGGVTRGVCRVDRSGWLESVVEVLGVQRMGSAIVGDSVGGESMILTGQEHVSTNFWIFPPRIFPLLEEGLRSFLQPLLEKAGLGGEEEPEREFLLPSEVNRLLKERRARVRVLRSRDPFFGITHPQDWEWVAGGVRDLVEAGQYPEHLWG